MIDHTFDDARTELCSDLDAAINQFEEARGSLGSADNTVDALAAIAVIIDVARYIELKGTMAGELCSPTAPSSDSPARHTIHMEIHSGGIYSAVLADALRRKLRPAEEEPPSDDPPASSGASSSSDPPPAPQSTQNENQPSEAAAVA